MLGRLDFQPLRRQLAIKRPALRQIYASYAAYLFASDYDSDAYWQRETNVGDAGTLHTAPSTLGGYTFTRAGAVRYELESIQNNTLYGPELVKNGDASNGTANWTVYQGGHTVEGGQHKVTSTATEQGVVHQPVDGLVIGQAYRVRATMTPSSGNYASLGLGGATINNDQTYALTGGIVDLTFVAQTTRLDIYMVSGAGGFEPNGHALFDNISVTEARLYAYEGDELLSNGGFDSSAGWSNDGGASTISGGVANIPSGFYFYQVVTLEAGRSYKATFDILPGASGGACYIMGNGGTQLSTNITNAAGSKEVIFTTTSAHALVGIYSGGDISVDNFSLKPIILDAFDSYASNVPAIQPGVGYWARQGLTNRLLHSQEFDNASWTKFEASVSANAAYAPDGTLTADKLIPSAVSAFHNAAQGISVSASTTYTMSFFAKANGYQWLALNLSHGGVADYFGYFDLINGVVGSKHASVTTSIIDCGSGWYRCVISKATVAGQTAVSCQAFVASADPGDGTVPAAFVGNGTNGLYYWGAQCIEGAHPDGGPYIATTASAATAGEDLLTTNIFADGSALTDQDMLIMVRGTPKDTGGTLQYFLSVDDGTDANRVQFMKNAAAQFYAVVSSGGAGVISPAAGTVEAGVEAVMFARREGGEWRAGYYIDGTLTWLTAAIAGAFPVGMTKFRPGCWSSSGRPFRGTIHDARIIPGTFATDAAVIAAIQATL